MTVSNVSHIPFQIHNITFIISMLPS